MLTHEETYDLSNDGIAAMQEECGKLYQELIPRRRQNPVSKFELESEELLLLMQVAYGKESRCTLRARKTLFATYVDFIVPGNQIDPLDNDDEELAYSNQILGMYGAKPSYSYKARRNLDGTEGCFNVVSIEMVKKPMKNKMMFFILLAVALAVASRLVVGLFPPSVAAFLQEDIVSVVFTKMTTVITEVATFLVFLSVITGITGVGSSAALGRMGKRLLSSTGLTYLFSAIVFSAVGCSLYKVGSLTSQGDDVVKQLLQLVLDMIPNNLVECFATDNELQVIVLSFFMGFVLLVMGKRAEKITDALMTLSDFVNTMMSAICKVLPAVVYFGILNLLLGDVSNILSMYKVAIILVATSACIIAFLFIRLRITTGLSPWKLFAMQWPTTLINLTTSSQVAALPENMKCCKEKFGIDSNYVDFALPLCLVAYMPCGVAFLGGTVYGLADLSSIPIDATFVLKLALMSTIVAIAAPPIPGSAFAVLPIMMSGAGVPGTYYSIAIVLGTVLGYFLPALNGYCMQFEMLITSTKLGMIDKSRLGVRD